MAEVNVVVAVRAVRAVAANVVVIAKTALDAAALKQMTKQHKILMGNLSLGAAGF